MKESQLNSIINLNLKKIGFSHKIADPLGGMGIQNPFDGFSVFQNKSLYWETKLLHGFKAFNFKEIKPHQLENLLQIKKEKPDAICLINLGIFIPYKSLDILFFDIKFIAALIDKGKKSILKKELLEYKRNCLFLTTTIINKKRCFDATQILDKIIYQ